MSHLIPRELMNQNLELGMCELATGPFGNKSPSSSPKVKPIPFDPKKAMSLLQEAGWKLGEGGLIREKDGKKQKFEFTVMYGSSYYERYLTLIQQEMAKVGISMQIRQLEWSVFMRLFDSKKFDAMVVAWDESSPEPDPKPLYHSSAIEGKGRNFVSYSDSELDHWIDEYRITLDTKKRMKLIHKIHEKIAEDQPQSFLFNFKHQTYARTTRMKVERDSFKYATGKDTWRLNEAPNPAR